jgi:hypothetical protein
MVKQKPPTVSSAVEALKELVDHLQERKVRVFNGELLAPDGTRLWNLEMTFERERDHRARDPYTE